MKQITIAFDIDGTLLNNEDIPPATPVHMRPQTSVNLECVMLLQLLSRFTKNVRTIVWSGGGREYADGMVRRYGLERYVDAVYGKAEYDESIRGRVDITFDDIHDCQLADKNIIVKMK